MEDKNEMVTKKVFSAGMENISRQFNELAVMVQKGFAGITADIEALDERITKLEYNVEKELKGMHNLFDAIFEELKDIRKQLAQVDTREEIVDLELRVDKIEKKLRFRA